MKVDAFAKLACGCGFLSLLLPAVTGCGGSFERPVTTRATLNVDPPARSNDVQMIVTYQNREPGAGEQCTLDNQPMWCRQAFTELTFDVQPSRTLYRIYARNEGTSDVTVRVSLDRDGRRMAQTNLAPGQTKWIWEIGVRTVEVKNAFELRTKAPVDKSQGPKESLTGP